MIFQLLTSKSLVCSDPPPFPKKQRQERHKRRHNEKIENIKFMKMSISLVGRVAYWGAICRLNSVYGNIWYAQARKQLDTMVSSEPANWFNLTSSVVVASSTNDPNLLWNRRVIEIYGEVVLFSLGFFMFCWIRDFCQRTDHESDLFPFSFTQYIYVIQLSYDMQYIRNGCLHVSPTFLYSRTFLPCQLILFPHL